MASVKDRRQTERGRFYEIEGVGSLPSVTTILKVIGKGEALLQWAAKVEREMVIEAASNLYQDCAGTPPMSKAGWIATLNDRIGKTRANQKELQKAAEIGSQAHALIEWKLKAKMLVEAGPSPPVTDKAVWAFNAWENWARSTELRPIFIEQVVYSEKYGFAGTLDLFAEVKTVPTVIDWKTGKKVYSESHLQNAAYRHALREMGHGDPKAGMIVRLPKVETDPEFEVIEALPEAECFDIFLHALELWTWSQTANEKVKAGAAPAQVEGFTPVGDLTEPLKQSINQQAEKNGLISMELADELWKIIDGWGWNHAVVYTTLEKLWGVKSVGQIKTAWYNEALIHFDRRPTQGV